MGSNANDMTYNPQTIATSEFYAFGNLSAHWRMLSKSYENGYRYGFNGQERDDEVYGNGNSYTAEFWQYYPRLGRRWNVDPVDKPWMSPYHAFSNKPITNSDPNGACDDCPNEAEQLNEARKEGTLQQGEEFTGVTGRTFVYESGLGWLEKSLLTDNGSANSSNKDSDNNIDINKTTIQSKEIGRALFFNDKLFKDLMQSATPEEQSFYFNSRLAFSQEYVGKRVLAGTFAISALIIGSVELPPILLNPNLYATNLTYSNLDIGAANATTNLAAQLAFNGGNFGDVNLTSVAFSFVFKHSFTASFIGSGFGWTYNDGFIGFGKRSTSLILTEIGLGTASGFMINQANLHIGLTKSTIKNYGIGTSTSLHLNMLSTGFTNVINNKNEKEK